jgi:primosomal protein N' (replication factor Y)
MERKRQFNECLLFDNTKRSFDKDNRPASKRAFCFVQPAYDSHRLILAVMERITLFADIIVPQALPVPLTYRVPYEWNDSMAVGQRVVVPLGKNKLITGIIRTLHSQPPQRYQAKYIDALLDERPLIHPNQLALWDWMASYYCCTLGDVMNAALPAGLKLSSETKFVLVCSDDESHLPEREAAVIRALRTRGSMTLDDVADLLGLKQVQPYVKRLLEWDWIKSEEELREKYKPKTADFISLGAAYNHNNGLNDLFKELESRRAQKQVDALMTFLQLTHWDGQKPVEIDRVRLQKQGVNSAVVNALVEKGIFTMIRREIGRLSADLLHTEPTRALSASQSEAKDSINQSWLDKDICLLHGVTSSGKTEVYASLIEEKLKEGKQVLFLLPEIALTTQIIQRLRKFFGKRVGVYHSGYSDNERTEVWNKVLSDVPGECDIVLGARSALFLPFQRLGLVIVDEEHEQSFKQHDPAPRYQARDTALWLAAKFGAKVLLGSATPSIETYWNAVNGRYGLVKMTERFGGMQLPEVLLCDIRKELKEKTMHSHFTEQLLNEMHQAIERGEQIILFQNRRGYSPLWECESCGWVPMCTRCDVSLTYHKHAHQLKCHYCGYTTQPVPACHACGTMDMKMLGFGTEKIEEDLQAHFPDVRVQRMDLDTTRSKSSYQKIISDFEAGVTRILVGTQMVTKGLDFDNVSLVGILSADKMMNYPDFRSMERSFQIMMQVAGRAGRRNKRGRVLIQTYSPDHWLLDLIVKGDYETFYEREVKERHQFSYPPFVRLMRITLKHKEDAVAMRAAQEIARIIAPVLKEKVLGPERPYIPRINNYFLQQFLVRLDKKPESAAIKATVIQMIRQRIADPDFKQVRLSVDVDPL